MTSLNRKPDTGGTGRSTVSPGPNRRNLLTGSAAAVGAALVSGAAAQAQQQTESADGSVAPAPWHQDPVLVAVASLVMPTSSLDETTRGRTLQRFGAWADGFEPVAELDHRYLSTDEIPYGPPDPRPLWRAQLAALDTEAQKRHLVPFADLDEDAQKRMLTRAIERSTPREPGTGLPRPESAAHVGIALMAWFFRSSDANDICHGKRIGRHECRGMRGVELEPRPLPGR